MKKTAIILGAAFLFLAATVKAQTETQPKEPTKAQADSKESATTQVVTAAVADKWNNWSPDKYKMLPMPAPLTTEKIFPVIGQYTVTSSDAAASATTTENTTSFNVSIVLDETNKGIAWVEGLPQGKIKAYLRKSPGTYMIPAQKTADEKDVTGGVLIYEKEGNKLDVCIGCTFNAEDPASAFTTPVQPVVEEQPVVKSKTKKSAKVKKSNPVAKTTWKYSGSKVGETTASVTTMQ
jgi:hypothetical protein